MKFKSLWKSWIIFSARINPKGRLTVAAGLGRSTAWCGSGAIVIWFFTVLTGSYCTVANADGLSLDNPSKTIQFAVLSDLHFNPFLCTGKAYTNLAGNPGSISNWSAIFAAYAAATDRHSDYRGQDASYYLLNATLTNLVSHTNLAFVLCTGDLFVHEAQIRQTPGFNNDEFKANRVNYTINAEALVAHLMTNCGLRNVFPTLGNNDSVGDYWEPSTDFLLNFEKAWAGCVPQGTFGEAFEKLGCYQTSLPGLPAGRLIAFNSSLFSFRAKNLQPEVLAAATNWVGTAMATNQESVLLFHIPPGSDYFKSKLFNTQEVFWAPNVQDWFLKTVAAHSDQLLGSFCSHTHNDEFRLLYKDDKPAHFFHISPSISPVHSNSPAYQIFTATTNGMLLGYDTYFITNFTRLDSAWVLEYNFANTYQVGRCNPETLDELYESGPNRKVNCLNFMRYYAPGLMSSSDDTTQYWRDTILSVAPGIK